jgi:hypothetical protein
VPKNPLFMADQLSPLLVDKKTPPEVSSKDLMILDG